MEKEAPDGHRNLVLDLCPRCGGLWFDPGEVQLLRAGSRFALPAPTDDRHRSQCHSCGSVVDRDAAACPACDYPNDLRCPKCQKSMERASHESVVLDMCTSCRGVWFDRHEVAAVWTLVLTTAVQRVAPTAVPDGTSGAVDAGAALLDILSYSPDVAVAIVEGTGPALGASVELLSAAPEAAGAVAEAAGAVFEVLIEIVAAILSGLSV